MFLFKYNKLQPYQLFAVLFLLVLQGIAKKKALKLFLFHLKAQAGFVPVAILSAHPRLLYAIVHLVRLALLEVD